ncbi:MAG: helix-turn-helix transcriptional regulator [Rhodospirillales bacterium]|nr:helix-turn-helix transcriptional regulator [Rhodospirillales bacterium]
MASEIDFVKLGAAVKARRGDKGLREAAEEIGDISPSTLSRIEGKRATDISMSTYLQLCDWLEVSPETFIQGYLEEAPPELDIPDTIELQLRASKELEPQTAQMLAEMFKAAYREAKKRGDMKE